MWADLNHADVALRAARGSAFRAARYNAQRRHEERRRVQMQPRVELAVKPASRADVEEPSPGADGARASLVSVQLWRE
jgi:hypothetical protein